MNYIRSALILGVCEVFIATSAINSNISQEQYHYNELVNKVISETEKIEIIYFPEYILTRTALTKEMLTKGYRFKFICSDLPSSVKFKSLCRALKTEDISTVTDYIIDLRWGCLFYDACGNQILSIYLSGNGKVGYIQDCPIMFRTNKLYHWLKTNFGACFE